MNLTYYHLSSWLLNYSIHSLNLIENSKNFPSTRDSYPIYYTSSITHLFDVLHVHSW